MALSFICSFIIQLLLVSFAPLVDSYPLVKFRSRCYGASRYSRGSEPRPVPGYLVSYLTARMCRLIEDLRSIQ